MTSELALNVVIFNIGDRKIQLNKDLIERYSEIVCPITEDFISDMVYTLGKTKRGIPKPDDELSLEIALDMTQEIHEYGY